MFLCGNFMLIQQIMPSKTQPFSHLVDAWWISCLTYFKTISEAFQKLKKIHQEKLVFKLYQIKLIVGTFDLLHENQSQEL